MEPPRVLTEKLKNTPSEKHGNKSPNRGSNKSLARASSDALQLYVACASFVFRDAAAQCRAAKRRKTGRNCSNYGNKLLVFLTSIPVSQPMRRKMFLPWLNGADK
jgi:hypothetical protein